MNILDAQKGFSIPRAAALAAGINPLFIRVENAQDGLISKNTKFFIAPGSNVSPKEEDDFELFLGLLIEVITTGELTPHGILFACDDETLNRLWEKLEKEVMEGLITRNDLYIEYNSIYSMRFSLKHTFYKKSDIKALLEKYGINDKFFNPEPEKPKDEKPETPDTDSTLPLIQWDSSDADFACLIDALYHKGYIRAKDLSEALRVAAPHFAGVNTREKTLIQGKNNRMGKNKNKFEGISAK